MPVEDIVGCVASSAPVDAVVFPAYWRWPERLWTWRRPSGHLHCMAVAIPGISLRWSTWARREEQGRLRPGGAESRRRERNPLEYRTAADHMDDGCSPENVRRLDMDPHRTFKTCSPGSEIATGGVFLSGNAETRRRADSKKLETADLKKAAAPLATHMRRLRGVRPEDEAPHVPESVGAEVPNDSRLQRQTRLQHRHRLVELPVAVRVRPSISQTSAGKRMAASHRWRRRKSAPAKDTPSSSPRGTGNGTENGRERAASSPFPRPFAGRPRR